MRACCLIRKMPLYRRDSFVSGLRATGYEVHESAAYEPTAEDLLLIWSRYGSNHALAQRYERAGARVLVSENGSLGREWRNGYWYNVTIGAPNVPASRSAPERWDGWGIPMAPWRSDGKHVLVFAQRGIGPPGVAQPAGWYQWATSELHKITKRPVRVREHPGENVPRRSLAEDLRDAWACVTWSSGAAIKALLSGVPVFYGLSHWPGAEAALPFGNDIEYPFLGDRLPMFRRLAWAMWDVREIATGEPFR